MSDTKKFTLAFTSCMSTHAFCDTQPVWKQIANESPDALVLLGDSVYIDCPPVGDGNGCEHPSDASYVDRAFAEHLLNLYRKQLAVPEFAALLAKIPAFAIWDDHDFLWNDADSSLSNGPSFIGRMILSANLFRYWCKALEYREPLPIHVDDIPKHLWPNPIAKVNQSAYDTTMPGYRNRRILGDKVILHLTDGRSWRHRMHQRLLGEPQRQAIEKVMADAPQDALHIFASGSTVQKYRQENWQTYPDDLCWLQKMASRYNILVISGDIHELKWSKPLPCRERFLYEAVASGAAVNFAPWKIQEKEDFPGQYSQKFGVLNIDLETPGRVLIRLIDHGTCMETQTLSLSEGGIWHT
jgi:alkaline phosphatase D